MGWLPRGQVLSRLVEEGGLMDWGGVKGSQGRVEEERKRRSVPE